MKIILMGEPMGLFMANESGSLCEVNTFTASIAGAEYNVAVGLARLGHTPAYCTRLGFDPLGERILNGLRQNHIATDLVMQTESAQTGFMMKAFTQKGDPDIAYYRKGSAASQITTHDIDGLDLYGCERLHVTGHLPRRVGECPGRHQAADAPGRSPGAAHLLRSQLAPPAVGEREEDGYHPEQPGPRGGNHPARHC